MGENREPLEEGPSAELSEFRALLNAAVDGIVAIDHDGRVIEFNPAAQRLFGYSAEEMIGQNVCKLMPEPDHSNHHKYIERYLDTGEKKIIGVGREVTGCRSDGTTFPMHLSVGAAGDRFVGIIRDLSAEKQAEQEGRQLKDRLAEVDRFSLMGELAAGLAHEINQPLSAIASYAQTGQRLTARGAVDNELLTDICRKITEQALRAGQIIQNLRGFVSRRERHEDRLDINTVVDSLLDLIEADARTESIPVSTELAPDMPPVTGDAVQLQQVLLNLTHNAVDAMRNSADKEHGIRIRTGRIDHLTVQVVVIDHGPGVPAKLADTIFHPFVTTKSDGLGVGLAVSSTIVQAHGGQLYYRPNPEGGSIFGFSLPVEEEA